MAEGKVPHFRQLRINVRFFFFFFKAYLEPESLDESDEAAFIQIIEKSGLRELLVSKSQFW